MSNNIFQSLHPQDNYPDHVPLASHTDSSSSPDNRSPPRQSTGRGRTRQQRRAKYIGRACQDCQRRKVKCSGEDICRHCRLRGTQCIYMPKTRRGRRRVNDITNREAQVNEGPGPSPKPSAPQDNERNSGAQETANEFAIPSPETTTGPEIASGLDEDTDAYDVAETRPRSVSLSSQLQALRELVRPDPRRVSDLSSARNPRLNRVFPVQLPRPAKLRTLLDVYFRDLDAYFPFLDRKVTESRILRTLTKLGYSEGQHIVDVDFRHHSTVALLCNMIAVGECFCSADAGNEDVRPGWSSFVWGRKLIQSCSSPKYVDLDLIRYHALSAEYLMQSELLQAASQAISNATQLSMLERLNDERAWQHLPKQEATDRKLLWWIIYFLDRKIAQRIGAPYIIRDVEVSVSEFWTEDTSGFIYTTDKYMQALVNLAKLWTQIWDSFFATAAAAAGRADWREVEVMDTRILIVQRELHDELTWETGLLDSMYLARGELETQIRRRISIFIRTNLLRLTIRQNPLQKNEANKSSRSICTSLASQTVEAIAAYTERCPTFRPCGFLFCTALLECIYHLIFAVRDSPQEERTKGIEAFKLSYRLLVRFSQTLDTAKRAICALNSAVCAGTEFGLLLKDSSEYPDHGNGAFLAANALHQPVGDSLQDGNDPFTLAAFPMIDDSVPGGEFQYDEHFQTLSGMDSDFWGLIPSGLDGIHSPVLGLGMDMEV